MTTPSATLPAPPPDVRRTLPWRDWQAGLDEAGERGVPVVCLAEAPWSNGAQRLALVLDQDDATRRLVEDAFVPVLVDPIHRPDIAGRLRWAATALTGTAGPPLLVVLTPGGAPFLAYCSLWPEGRAPYPSLRSLLRSIATLGSDRRSAMEAEASGLRARAPSGGRLGDAAGPGRRTLRRPARTAQAPARSLAVAAAGRGRRPCRPHPPAAHARRDAQRRHPRPARRQLPPLRPRRTLGGAPLREAGPRQRGARRRVRRRGHRLRPPRPRRDGPHRRRLRPRGPRHGHDGRRGRHRVLHLDPPRLPGGARRGPGPGARPALRHRPRRRAPGPIPRHGARGHDRLRGGGTGGLARAGAPRQGATGAGAGAAPAAGVPRRRRSADPR